MHSPGHVHSLMHVCSLFNSQEYMGAFKKPYGYLIHQLLLFGFMVGLLFSPNNTHFLRQLLS